MLYGALLKIKVRIEFYNHVIRKPPQVTFYSLILLRTSM